MKFTQAKIVILNLVIVLSASASLEASQRGSKVVQNCFSDCRSAFDNLAGYCDDFYEDDSFKDFGDTYESCMSDALESYRICANSCVKQRHDLNAPPSQD
jgi:hypothetical protein